MDAPRETTGASAAAGAARVAHGVPAHVSWRTGARGQAWSAAAGAAAMLAIEFLVHDVVMKLAGPGAQARFWVLALAAALPLVLAARLMPAPLMVGVGMVAGSLLMAGLVAAGILWAVPASCADPGAFCEGVGLDRLVVVVAPALWGVPALVAGWIWRRLAGA